MKKILITILALLFFSPIAFAATTTLVAPEQVLQGNVARVTTDSAPFLKKLVFDGKQIPVFTYNGRPRAFIGIDLVKKPGAYTLTATLTNGEVISKKITVLGREKPRVESVAIPEKLGGNTTSSQNELVASIAVADTDIKKVRTGGAITWAQKFISPLGAMTVTTPYGYGVDIGAHVLPHKGLDLKAAVGTDVRAMNRGVVKIAKEYRSYGKMVLIDHGMGIQTLYLHLSKINVREGEAVARDKIIGLSGETGYVSGPHLHLSVRIGGISIDPLQFLKLFNP